MGPLGEKKQGLQTSCHRPFNIKARELCYTVCTYVSRGGVPSVPCLVLHVPAHDALLIHAGHHGELPGMAMLTACMYRSSQILMKLNFLFSRHHFRYFAGGETFP
jgi:hypothetical protein